MGSEVRGSHWNRAGRRSGGYRPSVIYLPRLIPHLRGLTVACDACDNTALPYVSTRNCGRCAYIVRLILQHDKELRDAD